jgi:hypothetical protein
MKILTSGIEIDESDALCLYNDIPDIEYWIRAALLGKVNNCKKRLINEWHPKLLADEKVRSLPGDVDGLVRLITSRDDYKNRNQRDAAESEESDTIRA